MRIRIAMIALAAASVGAVAVAQPDKDEQSAKAPKPAAAAAAAAAAGPVVLASASNVRRPSSTDSERAAEPVRRPTPRVTTCRCGDPQPADDQPDE